MTEDVAPDNPLHLTADALIEAHEHAVADADDKLIELIEAALLHVGRHIARESRSAHDPLIVSGRA